MVLLKLLRLPLALGLLALLVAAPRPAEAQAAAEYDVKAAFLYNFTKFVEWPASSFPDERSALKLCVLGEDPFGKSLQTVVDEEVSGRKLMVLRADDVFGLTGCHVLFISRSERERLPRVIAAVQDLPVLTVADTPGFLDKGGAINFLLDGSKVRFEINQAAAERARLKISSKLLRLATRVKGNPEARGGA